MLGKEWHPFVTFEELIRELPKYVEGIKSREKDETLYCLSIANFELG